MIARSRRIRRRRSAMNRKTKWIVGGAVALAVVGGGAGAAIATGGDDDKPLTGSALDQATAAALAHTGGGTVIETEVGDGGSAYGVEVRLPDGSVVEVALNADFQVVGQESDDDGPNDPEGVDED
jgi:uncharacterized membrane protein YkoI